MGRRFMPSGDEKPPKPEGKKEKRKGRKKKKRRDKENKINDTVFIRQTKDGSTSLSILPPGEGIIPGTEKDRPISLGHLIGRVRVGTSYLYGFREDKRNIIKAMYPLNYSFYSSYGPSYDSTFSNLTFEETKLLQSGEKFANNPSKQYTDVIRRVCVDDYSQTFVDHMIDILEGKETKEDEEKVVEVSKEVDDEIDDVDFEALKSLSQDGIDMSFLDNLKVEYESREASSVEERLDLTAQLINNLRTTQNSRLAVCPINALNQVAQPSQVEMKLASRVIDNLTSLLQNNTKPGDCSNLSALRKAMGIALRAGDKPESSSGKQDIAAGNQEVKEVQEVQEIQDVQEMEVAAVSV